MLVVGNMAPASLREGVTNLPLSAFGNKVMTGVRITNRLSDSSPGRCQYANGGDVITASWQPISETTQGEYLFGSDQAICQQGATVSVNIYGHIYQVQFT